ncbi:MAG: sigma-70 family RNA polymerase sigma factor [Burkholderiales bacterium]|nr:sigma-70 family RNA polymerase sigma factor [Burkholderiales bacterium]
MDPHKNKELADLLAACGRRDRAAFARLYQATSAQLFGVAIRMLRREDLAEEILQECYVSIWNNAAGYTAALSAPMTWMTSIVRNRCLDSLRRPNMEVVLSGRDADEAEDPLAAMPSDAPGPLAQLQSASDARALARCLAALEPKMRQAIALAFFDGLSHSELAAHMRQPLGTVKTWVRRGLERLRACLGGD